MKILVVFRSIPTQMNGNGAGVRTCVVLNIADYVVGTFLVGICLVGVVDVGIDTCHVHTDLLHFIPDIAPLGLSGRCFFLLRLLRVFVPGVPHHEIRLRSVRCEGSRGQKGADHYDSQQQAENSAQTVAFPHEIFSFLLPLRSGKHAATAWQCHCSIYAGNYTKCHAQSQWGKTPFFVSLRKKQGRLREAALGDYLFRATTTKRPSST